jgi:hypothetical protein
VKQETPRLKEFKTEDLKGVKTIRKTNFKKQVTILAMRYYIGLFRVPLALFALIGMALFSSFLIANLYYNTG